MYVTNIPTWGKKTSSPAFSTFHPQHMNTLFNNEITLIGLEKRLYLGTQRVNSKVDQLSASSCWGGGGKMLVMLPLGGFFSPSLMWTPRAPKIPTMKTTTLYSQGGLRK